LPLTCFTEAPFAATAGGVRVAIRLTPRARADQLEGIVRGADGAAMLKASVTAPPAEGRANDALLALLAKSWGVPRRDLAIVGGAKSRNKTVHVAGDPAELLSRLAALLSSLPAA
jgi:uncharacterized protein (TIGR00251 family)